jgi:hypothetical protein
MATFHLMPSLFYHFRTQVSKVLVLHKQNWQDLVDFQIDTSTEVILEVHCLVNLHMQHCTE